MEISLCYDLVNSEEENEEMQWWSEHPVLDRTVVYASSRWIKALETICSLIAYSYFRFFFSRALWLSLSLPFSGGNSVNCQEPAANIHVPITTGSKERANLNAWFYAEEAVGAEEKIRNLIYSNILIPSRLFSEQAESFHCCHRLTRRRHRHYLMCTSSSSSEVHDWKSRSYAVELLHC